MQGFMNMAAGMMQAKMGGMGMPGFDPRSIMVNPHHVHESEDDEDSDDDHVCKRRGKKKRNTIKDKRLAQKIKESLDAHVKRMSKGTVAPKYDPTLVIRQKTVAKKQIKKKPEEPEKSAPTPTLGQNQEEKPPTTPTVNETAKEKPSPVRYLESKEIQTIQETQSSINVIELMEREIEVFKEKRDSFINYLQQLQNDLKLLKLPDDPDEIKGSGDKNETDGESSGTTDKIKIINIRQHKQPPSKLPKKSHPGPNEVPKDKRKEKRKRLVEEATKDKSESTGRVRIKGFVEDKRPNLDEILPRLEKIANKTITSQGVRTVKSPDNYIRRIR